MPHYVVLVNWTNEGIKNVKESPKRLANAKALLEKLGGKLTAIYYTMGPHDLVAIGDAPDDDIMNRFLLELGRVGAVRTTTLKAWTEAEAAKLFGSLS
jgi:uncharacterized protein with GYD domain